MSATTIPTAIGDLTITRATAADNADVFGLLDGAAQWLHGRGIASWLPGDFTPANVAEMIARYDVRLARADTTPVGTLTLFDTLPPFDRIVWGDVPDDALYIHRFAVNRACAGRGIGHDLLRWAENIAAAAGKTCLRLDCWADDAPLCRYYEGAGFLFRGRIDMGKWNCARYEKAISPF